MPRSHLDEEVRPELAQDLEGVVPADRMRDAGREVLAYRLGIVEGATAAIAREAWETRKYWPASAGVGRA